VEEHLHRADGADYFGACPYCGKNDGYVNIGRSHWFKCDEHQTRWLVGSNLFSSWQYETEAEQRAWYDAHNFGAWEEVEPAFPKREGAPEQRGERR
jgi:hypothetical protein